MAEILDLFRPYWPHMAAAANFALNLVTSAHVVLCKRDTRAAIGWVAVIWLVPFLGAFLYVVLGINRIRRRAHRLLGEAPEPQSLTPPTMCPADIVQRALGDQPARWSTLDSLVSAVTRRPLTAGNRVEPLVGGENAYPAMLAAIGSARQSISLCTYLFDNDRAGQQFLEALSLAHDRGVEVRVLIDAVGARYSWPSMVRKLQKAGVPVARFLPTRVPWRFRYSNLRNHRKLLVVDGRIAFTGGMNIGEANLAGLKPSRTIEDIQFRIEGPVVAQLQEVFAFDWNFTAEERLEGELWFPPLSGEGPVLARAIADGPDDQLDILPLTLQGAIASAQRSIHIVTPYFIPEETLISALKTAALRGIEVVIVLPEKNNLAMVHWASRTVWPWLLHRGCRIWLTPPPFDHAKLMLVDRTWALLGSANWDPRSLRLNFELNVECYDAELAGTLQRLIDQRIAGARQVTRQELASQGLPSRLRDGVARLASPYL